MFSVTRATAALGFPMPDHPCLLVEAKNGPVEKVVVALAVLSRDPLISKPEVLSAPSGAPISMTEVACACVTQFSGECGSKGAPPATSPRYV